MLAHVITMAAAYLTSFGWLAALIVYLVKKDSSRFVAFHALQALVLQIALIIAGIVFGIAGIITLGLTWLLLGVLVILAIVFEIIAAIKANEGEWYKLPIVGDFADRYLPTH